MPNGHGIKKETYVDADDKTARAMTFDILDSINSNVCTKFNAHEVRIIKLENRKKLDTGTSAGAGLIGGFIAVIGQKLFGL